jgi:hypothetical protein
MHTLNEFCRENILTVGWAIFVVIGIAGFAASWLRKRSVD